MEAEAAQGKRVYYPRHVVLATGTFISVPIRPKFEDEATFKGQVYHSINHKSVRDIENLQNKRVVVVGCSTSGHDICEDFVNCGAKEVSMIQRHPIFSVTRDSMEKVSYVLWDTPGITTEEADVIANSFPCAIVRALSVGRTRRMAHMDKPLLDGIERAGFAEKKGEDGVGMVDYQFIRGGYSYIDQGAMRMIVNGSITMYRCEQGIERFPEKGVELADGRDIDADIVVLATGYEHSIWMVEHLMGKEVREKVGGFGYLDEEQEMIGVSSSLEATSSILIPNSGGDRLAFRASGTQQAASSRVDNTRQLLPFR